MKLTQVAVPASEYDALKHGVKLGQCGDGKTGQLYLCAKLEPGDDPQPGEAPEAYAKRISG